MTASKRSLVFPTVSLVLAMMLACLSLSASAAKFYRWQDENGVTHYTDRPPADKQAETVRTTNVRGDSQPSANQSGQAEDKAEEVANEGMETQTREKNPERCAIARNNLKALKENARVRVKENGEYRFLGEKELSSKRAEAQRIIQEDC